MLVFAHRGDSVHGPENTLNAFSLALQHNIDGIELDVHQCLDNWAVIHDSRLERTTNGQGLVTQYSMQSLQRLDGGQGEVIPSLWDVLSLVRGQTSVNIEVKGARDVSLLIPLLEKAQLELRFTQQQLIVSSFNHHWLQTLKQLKPDLVIGALTASLSLDYAHYASQLNAAYACISQDVVTKEFVEQAHAKGLKVLVYTVDLPEEIQAAYALGVDGIFTNDPALAKNVIQRLE